MTRREVQVYAVVELDDALVVETADLGPMGAFCQLDVSFLQGIEPGRTVRGRATAPAAQAPSRTNSRSAVAKADISRRAAGTAAVSIGVPLAGRTPKRDRE